MTRYSLVIPVYMNEGSIPELLKAVSSLNRQLHGELEVVFVVDGSPDGSFRLLQQQLGACDFASQLLLLARNFGSFAAIRVGLQEARGPLFAVMAADLQEPPELVAEFFQRLVTDPVDVVLGARVGRADPGLSRLASGLFWSVYRRFVQPEMPEGGFDVFGCNAAFRDTLLALGERNSSLVGLIVWMGFRRVVVPYERLARRHGKSGWTLRKKLKYMTDSLFAFSDLPIRMLIGVGVAGLVLATGLGSVAFALRVLDVIRVPGYTAILLVVLFFAALNAFGLGIIGSYVWRTFENTKGRPQAVVMSRTKFGREAL